MQRLYSEEGFEGGLQRRVVHAKGDVERVK